MATTTNFGWETPDDTDLVKDGALAIRTLGSAIDTSLVDLKGGTTGQVLSKTSNTDMDFTWVAVDPLTILDAKGDLITATAADTPARLAVGTNGQYLQADSTTATGLKWASIATGFKGALVYVSSSQSIANSTDTYVTFAAETFDTDSFHDNVTNNTRLTIPTGLGGKYLFTAIVGFDTNTTGRREAIMFRNRTTVIASTLVAPTTGNWTQWGFSQIIDASAGDYFELRVWQNSGGSLNLPSSTTGGTTFACQYLGA
jgi:hypothetical protein